MARRRRSRGSVSVIRVVLPFVSGESTGFATTQRCVSASAGLPGNSDAVWPSGPMPRQHEIEHRRRAERGDERSLVVAPPRPPDRARRRCDGRARMRPSGSISVLLRHPVVRVGMIGRHGALVAPPQLDAVPRQRVAARRGEHLEQPLRRRAARQRDVARAARRDRDRAREFVGRRAARARRDRQQRSGRASSACRALDVTAELEPHRRQHLLGERVVLARAEPREQRRRDHVGRHAPPRSPPSRSSGPRRSRATLPVNFASVGILDQRLRGEIDQPRRQHAAAPPHLGDVGDRELEAVLLGDRRVRARPS